MKTVKYFSVLAISVLVLFFGSVFIACDHASDGVTPSGPESMTSVDAITFLAPVRIGINISASLDAFRDLNYYDETAWGNPRINQTLLNNIAAEGFDIVRIPITWIGYIGDAPDYKISEERLRRVAEVVNMARRAGLKVIINIHHDATYLDQFAQYGWLHVNQASQSSSERERITNKFQIIWRQIAEYFINFGDYLIFESFNEVFSLQWPSPSMEMHDIINDWNRVFVNTVRNTGGNNRSRFLIVKGYASDPEHTINRLIIPSDPLNAVNRLIVSFHYYAPHEFTHGNRLTWGTASERAAVDRMFEDMGRTFKDRGIPVILGEFGLRYNPAIANVQKDFLSHIVGSGHRHGIPSLYWCGGIIDDGFLLFDRNTGRLFPFMESYLQAMMNALQQD